MVASVGRGYLHMANLRTSTAPNAREGVSVPTRASSCVSVSAGLRNRRSQVRILSGALQKRIEQGIARVARLLGTSPLMTAGSYSVDKGRPGRLSHEPTLWGLRAIPLVHVEG